MRTFERAAVAGIVVAAALAGLAHFAGWATLPAFIPVALIPWLRVFLFPAVTFLLILFFHKKDPVQWEAWAMKNPFFAAVIELCKALGFDLPSTLKVFENYAARKAGTIPPSAVLALPWPPAVRKLLANPSTQAAVVALVSKGEAELLKLAAGK